MTPKPHQAGTRIPSALWNSLLEAAKFFPAPQQFYERAINLAHAYGITEKELIEWGIIDAHHKPKERPAPITPRQVEENIRNYTEPREQQAPVTEEDIVRGHREKGGKP